MILLAHFTGLPHDAESLTLFQCAYYAAATAFSYALAVWRDNRNQRKTKEQNTMPCDTIQTVSVNLSSLGKLDRYLMLAALNALKLNAMLDGKRIVFGRGEYIDTATGQSQFMSMRDINEIKRAYAREVVKAQAKANNWTLTETGPGQFEAVAQY